jgi:hypothetical protein
MRRRLEHKPAVGAPTTAVTKCDAWREVLTRNRTVADAYRAGDLLGSMLRSSTLRTRATPASCDPGAVRLDCSSCPQDLSPGRQTLRPRGPHDYEVRSLSRLCRKPLRTGLVESLRSKEVLHGARQQVDLQALCARAGDLDGGLER